MDRRGDSYVAYVRGTYDASSLPSLVREHNGPGFVEDGSSDRLPYDPRSAAVTGRIAAMSGTVSVKDPDGAPKSATGILEQGDSVDVSAGGAATAFLSDGTELRIGGAAATSLKITELSVADPKGFLTRVRLALNSGEAWAKAPKLREAGDGRSELEIESGGAVASVRGTVFGVANVSATSARIMVAEGSVALEKTDGTPIAVPGSGNVLSVPEGGTPKEATVTPGTMQPPAEKPELSDKAKAWLRAKNRAKAKAAGATLLSGKPRFTIETGDAAAKFAKYSLWQFKKATGNWEPGISGTPPMAGDGKFNVSTNLDPLEFSKVRVVFATCADAEGTDCSEPGTAVLPCNAFSRMEFPDPDSDPNDGCAPGTAKFAGAGCADSRLVAWAPYETFSHKE